jgi:hypothetical protein
MDLRKIGHWLVSIGIITIGWILFDLIMELGYEDFKFNAYSIGAGIVLGVFFNLSTDYSKKYKV